MFVAAKLVRSPLWRVPSASASTMAGVNLSSTIDWICSGNRLQRRDHDERNIRLGIIGASDDPERPSHRVAKRMQELGYEVIPINPKAMQILGKKSAKSLADAPGPIDVCVVFRAEENCPDTARDAVKAKSSHKVKAFWMQLDVKSEEAAKIALDGGLEVVMDKCIMTETENRVNQTTPNLDKNQSKSKNDVSKSDNKASRASGQDRSKSASSSQTSSDANTPFADKREEDLKPFDKGHMSSRHMETTASQSQSTNSRDKDKMLDHERDSEVFENISSGQHAAQKPIHMGSERLGASQNPRA